MKDANEPGSENTADTGQTRRPRASNPIAAPRSRRPERPATDKPLHRSIYEQLLMEIQGGAYAPGDRLPSEALLCERFKASRITVAKAIQSLQRDRLVSRRAGSGTYVQAPAQGPALRFGLLIPELGNTDIFEPICQGIMGSPLGKSHSLIWGHAPTRDDEREAAAEQLCRQYIAQKVSGVFFAPLEFAPSRDRINRLIISLLCRAAIPVVLLDRCFERYPLRSDFDLIGIDNHRAGFVLTQHLIDLGASRILFAHRPHSAPTVEQRAAGYREALRRAGHTFSLEIGDLDFADAASVRGMLDRHHPDAIVCANDLTAATFMRTLLNLGVHIPQQIRIVGVDDVPYAKFLPVPLTTLRQDCPGIGAAALWTMLNRIERPDRPARDILANFELIIRGSCGSRLTPPSATARTT